MSINCGLFFDFIKKHGAVPSFLHYNGFPGSICASPNSWVVHGIPSKNVILKEGDIISIDIGACKNGYHGDAARTFPVGKISDDAQRLIDVTKQSFFEGVKHAVHGAKLGDVSAAIQEYVEDNGYSVVRDLVGHGIGKDMHEDPPVPNYGRRGNGATLKNGMCIAIEPMITMGDNRIGLMPDKWSIVTLDHKPAAHFEHTIVVHHGKSEILSSFEEIERLEGEIY